MGMPINGITSLFNPFPRPQCLWSSLTRTIQATSPPPPTPHPVSVTLLYRLQAVLFVQMICPIPGMPSVYGSLVHPSQLSHFVLLQEAQVLMTPSAVNPLGCQTCLSWTPDE